MKLYYHPVSTVSRPVLLLIHEAAIKVEILWNKLADKFSFALLCGYAMGNFYKQAKQLEDICALHTYVTGPDNVVPFDSRRITRTA